MYCGPGKFGNSATGGEIIGAGTNPPPAVVEAVDAADRGTANAVGPGARGSASGLSLRRGWLPLLSIHDKLHQHHVVRNG